MSGTVVVALGGHALDGVDLSAVAVAVSTLIGDRAAVVTHGNGPQVGAAVRRRAAAGEVSDLDVADAETQGELGYRLTLELADHLPGREVCTVLTRVVVDADDPAFDRPTKVIGTGAGRWAVPSPEPREVPELAVLRRLVEAGVVIVAAGGGGIPVVLDAAGHGHGVDAVVDKDLTSSLLAIELAADELVLLTDVDGVHRRWPDDGPALRAVSVAGLRALDLEAGSMGPKAEAACRFVERTGRRAVIGALAAAAEVAAGRSGTEVRA